MPSPRPSGTPVSWEEVQSRAASRRAEAGKGSPSFGKSSSRNKSTPVSPSSAASAAARGARSAARARPNISFATVTNKHNNASVDVTLLTGGKILKYVPFQDINFGSLAQEGDQVLVGYLDRDQSKPFILGRGGSKTGKSRVTTPRTKWYSPYCDSGRTRINDNGGAYYNFVADATWRSPEHAAYTIPKSYNPENKQFMAQYSTSPQGLIAFTSDKYGGVIATSYYRASGPLQYVDIALSLMDYADEVTAIAPEIVITISGTWRDGRSLVWPDVEDVPVEPTRKMAFDEVRKELVVYFGLYDNRIVRINAATCELKSNQVLYTETKLMAGYDGGPYHKNTSTPFYAFRPAELFATNGYIFGEQRYATTPFYSGGTIGLERTIDPIEIPIWWAPEGSTTLRLVRTISFFPPVLDDFKKQTGHTPVGWNKETPITLEELGAQIQYCLRVVGDTLHIGYSFHGFKQTVQNYRDIWGMGPDYPNLDRNASGIISRVVGIARYSISTGSLLSSLEVFREDKSYSHSPVIIVPKFISSYYSTPEDAIAHTRYYEAVVLTHYRHTETYIQDFCVDPSGTQHLLYGMTSHTGEEFSLAKAEDKYARGEESTYTSSFCRKLAVYDRDNKQLYSGYADAPSATYTEWWGAGAVRNMSGSIGNPIFTPLPLVPSYVVWVPATCRVIGDTLAINPTISSSIRVHGKISAPRLSHLTDFGSGLSYRDLPTTIPWGNVEGAEGAAGYSIVGGAIPKDSVYPTLVLLVCGNYVPPAGFPSHLTGKRYYAKGGVQAWGPLYYNSIYRVLAGDRAYIPLPPQDYLPLHNYEGLAYWVSIRTDTMTITGRSEHFPYTTSLVGDGILFSRVVAANMVAFTAGKMYHPTITAGKWQMIRRT